MHNFNTPLFTIHGESATHARYFPSRGEWMLYTLDDLSTRVASEAETASLETQMLVYPGSQTKLASGVVRLEISPRPSEESAPPPPPTPPKPFTPPPSDKEMTRRLSSAFDNLRQGLHHLKKVERHLSDSVEELRCPNPLDKGAAEQWREALRRVYSDPDKVWAQAKRDLAAFRGQQRR